MPNGISRETWNKLKNDKDRQNILFDLMLDTNHRVRKLETRKKLDTAVSGMGGILGGAVVMFLQWLKIKYKQ